MLAEKEELVVGGFVSWDLTALSFSEAEPNFCSEGANGQPTDIISVADDPSVCRPSVVLFLLQL